MHAHKNTLTNIYSSKKYVQKSERENRKYDTTLIN